MLTHQNVQKKEKQQQQNGLSFLLKHFGIVGK